MPVLIARGAWDVIGEVIAGIALGPSLFSWFGYEASPLLPKDVAPYLSIIAQLGIVICCVGIFATRFVAHCVAVHAFAAAFRQGAAPLPVGPGEAAI